MLMQAVVGLSFGDEGKGSTVDWLVRRHNAGLVVRFNGGAQAGHNVVLPDGKHHCFSQFGSGTFAGANTLLSRFMLVNPQSFLREDAHLRELGYMPIVMVDERAIVTTPFHIAVNQIAEVARGKGSHGSCGMGIGETKLDERNGFALRVGDLLAGRDQLKAKLFDIQDRMLARATKLLAESQSEHAPQSAPFMGVLCDTSVEGILDRYKAFTDRIMVGEDSKSMRLAGVGGVVFEGAQGVLLDEYHGFHPHTTWSDCTFRNAIALAGEAFPHREHGPVRKIGVLRSYLTRHGAGPLVTEDHFAHTEEPHNTYGQWQGRWRTGHFDLVMARYALDAVNGVDGLVLTHLDSHIAMKRGGCGGATAGQWAGGAVCDRYEMPTTEEPLPRDMFQLSTIGVPRQILNIRATPVPRDSQDALEQEPSRLARMAQLTLTLAECKPRFMDPDWHENLGGTGYAMALAERMNAYHKSNPPLVGVSFGPTYRDRFAIEENS